MSCRRIVPLLLPLAILAIAGCASPPGEPATPSATEPVPTTSATASAAPTPSESTEPTASQEPGSAPYCGDAFVLERAHLVWWEGDETAQLASADVQPEFEPADAIAGLDVVCVASYSTPVDGTPGGVGRVSEAVLERDDEAFAQLESWAAANGYSPLDAQPGFVEHHAPANADGTTTRKIFWAPIDGDEPVIGDAADILRHTGAEPDAIFVWHVDFTQG